MTYGVTFGKYLPPHLGHLSYIEDAAKRCDKLFVIVCELTGRDKLLTESMAISTPFIDGEMRVSLMKELLEKLPNVIVLKINEDTIKPFPEAWLEWSNLIKNSVKESAKAHNLEPKEIDYIFHNEPSYITHISALFPTSKQISIDLKRETINTSATEVRKAIKEKNNSYISKYLPKIVKNTIL